MAPPTLQTRISLSHLHCVEEQEVIGDDEPYLWTAFFKVDGDTAVLDLIGDRPDDQLGPTDCFVRGTCTFVSTAGSHNNLGDTDVETGDVVGIPAGLGTAAFTLKPIPVTPRAQAKLGGTQFVDGAVGFVAGLLEEDGTSDSGAEAGHTAFSRALEEGINGFLYQDGGPTGPDDLEGKLGFTLRTPGDDQIAALKSQVERAAKSAIRDADGLDIDHDDFIASTHRFVSTQALVDDGVQEIYDRLLQITSNGSINAEYKLVGDILGIDAGAMNYSWFQRSEEYGTPAAAGVPTGFGFAGLGVTNIVYRDTDDRLHELWRDAAGTTGTTNLTAVAGATKAAGNPCAYADTDRGQVILAYRDDHSGHIHTMYWSTGAVGHENLSAAAGAPPAAGNPVALFVPESRTHHVIYRSGDEHLRVVYWQGGDAAGHEDMTAWSSAPAAAGDASPYYATPSREHIVVYRGTDGHVHDIHWRVETPFQHENLSAVAGTPLAAGDPSAYHIAAMDLHQMTYLGVDGHLYEIYCVGAQAVQGWDLSAAAGAPDAVVTSDPVAYYHAPTNTKHVVYREANDHLYDLQWVPGGGAPQRVDLTLMALADRAAGKPSAFLGLGTDQHVVYRSAGNQVHEILMRMTQ